MSYIKEHKEGFVLTILFHVVILLILLNLGFFTPLPLPDEKGVVVDFGNSDDGMGINEPSKKPTPVPQKQEEQQEQVAPPPKPIVESAPPKVNTNQGNEEIVTQDFEQTAAIEQGKKKKEEEDRKKREEEERKQKEKLEKELKEQKVRDQLAQIERQKQQEIEKRRKDSLQRIENARLAEIRRIAEQHRQDSIRRANEDAKIAEINSRAKNVFGGSTGQNNNQSNSSGQGVTYKPGNQGSTTGSAGSQRYGLGSGEGISFNLTGRSAETLRKPGYPGQEEGTVIVQITVDKYGKVTKATPGVKGSTSISPDLLEAAKKAALATQFNEDLNAPALQTGTITYRFVLD